MTQPPADPSQVSSTAAPSEADVPSEAAEAQLGAGAPALQAEAAEVSPPFEVVEPAEVEGSPPAPATTARAASAPTKPPPSADDLRALQNLERTIAGRRSWLDGYLKRKETAKAQEYIQQIQSLLDENASLIDRTDDPGEQLCARTNAYLADARAQLESVQAATQAAPAPTRAVTASSNALPPMPTPKPAAASSPSNVLPPKPSPKPTATPSASSALPPKPMASAVAPAPKPTSEALAKFQAAQRSLKNKRNWLDGNLQMKDFDKAIIYRDQLGEELEAQRPFLRGEGEPLGGVALLEETEKYLQTVDDTLQKRTAPTPGVQMQPAAVTVAQPSALDVLLRKLNDLQSRIDGNISAKELDRARGYHQQMQTLLDQSEDIFAGAGDAGASTKSRYVSYLQRSAVTLTPAITPTTSAGTDSNPSSNPLGGALDQIQKDLRRLKGWIDGNLRSANYDKAKTYRDELVQVVLQHANTLDAAGPPGHQLYASVVAYIKHVDTTLRAAAPSQQPRVAPQTGTSSLQSVTVDPLADLRKETKKLRGWIDGNLRAGNLDKVATHRAALGQLLEQNQNLLQSAGAAGQTLHQQINNYLQQVDAILKQAPAPAVVVGSAAPAAASIQDPLDSIYRAFKKLCAWLDGNLRTGDLAKAKQYRDQISQLAVKNQETIERAGGRGRAMCDEIDAYLVEVDDVLNPRPTQPIAQKTTTVSAPVAASSAPPNTAQTQQPPTPQPTTPAIPATSSAPARSPVITLPQGQIEYKSTNVGSPTAAPSPPAEMTRLADDDDDDAWSRPTQPRRPLSPSLANSDRDISSVATQNLDFPDSPDGWSQSPPRRSSYKPLSIPESVILSEDDSPNTWSRPSPLSTRTTPTTDDGFDDWTPQSTKPPKFNNNDFSNLSDEPTDIPWSKRNDPPPPLDDDDWSPPPPPLSNAARRASLDDPGPSLTPLTSGESRGFSRWRSSTPEPTDDPNMKRLVDDDWDAPPPPPVRRMPLPPGVSREGTQMFDASVLPEEPPSLRATPTPALAHREGTQMFDASTEDLEPTPQVFTRQPIPFSPTELTHAAHTSLPTPSASSPPPPIPPPTALREPKKPAEIDIFSDPSFGPDAPDSLTWLNRVRPFIQPSSHLFIGADPSQSPDDIARAQDLIPQAQAILNMQHLAVFPDEPSPRLSAAMRHLKDLIDRMPQTAREAAFLQHPTIHQAIDALEAKLLQGNNILHPVEVFHAFDLIAKIERLDRSLETGALRVRLFCLGISPP